MNRMLRIAAVALAVVNSGCVVDTPGLVVEPAVVRPVPVVVAPPPVLVGPPPALVLVPGTQVYTVAGASVSVFVFGGHYYTYHDGTWFHAPRHGAAWTPVAVEAVPVPVRSVPVARFHCPPGHARKGEC